MDFREFLLKDIETEENLLKEYDVRLKRLPAGNLCMRRSAKRAEYYHIDRQTGKYTYIIKENHKLLEDLQLKGYLLTSVKILRKNIKVQKKLLESYLPYNYAYIQSILPAAYRSNLPECKKTDDSDEQYYWEYNEEQKIHITTSGLRVRSKSEAMIIEMLNARKMKYEYEKPLSLLKNGGSITIHPDFTFKGKYGDNIYWEHFGMLSNEQYRKNALNKIEIYIINGIIPGNNLVITSEKPGGSIDINTISATIDMVEKLL